MTVLKNSLNDAVSVNDEVIGDFQHREKLTSLKVLKEIETDQESNASSEDIEFYSPRSVVVKKWPLTTKEVNLSRIRVHNPVLRIRSEDSQIGEDIGEGLISKFGNDRDRDRVDHVMMFSRPASPLSGKRSSIKTEQ